jgi:ADP-dependent NAD(P)H-hydrate dehydratase / NAD(P)H-hydrate epimerase
MITASRMAAVDANAAALGVSRKQLMESSGNAVARAIRELVEPGSEILILAGRGNNGGDALVATRFLDAYDVRVRLLGRAETISTPIAHENWAALQEAGYDASEVRDSAALSIDDPDLIVDAMLGTGINGALREPEASAARQANESRSPVLSVDVPSGTDADTGERPSGGVVADRIVTFHDMKPGLDGLDAAVTVADIGLPAAAERLVGPGDLDTVTGEHGSTKGDSGQVLVIGGGPYTGAPALAAQASLRAGADLAYVAVPERVFAPIASYEEDLIVQPYEADHLAPETAMDLVETANDHDDIVVLGPGLGTADETLQAVADFLAEFTGQAVIDADALSVVPRVETEATLVCTPNRKELAGMGGPDVDDLATNAEGIAEFAADLGHVVLAKGAADVITDGESVRINRAGTPGMTVGGTGDVLAGITAALLARTDPLSAASGAPYVNGRAAESVGASAGLLATDLLRALPAVLGGTR